MIINRFVTQLRQQNWATVFLEIIVVIVGVYIGLAANNYNQSLIKLDEQRYYLQTVTQDLQRLKKQFQTEIEHSQPLVEELLMLRKNVLSQQKTEANIQLFADLYRSLYSAPFMLPSMQTVDEITMSGKSSYFGQGKLRAKLNELMRAISATEMQIEAYTEYSKIYLTHLEAVIAIHKDNDGKFILLSDTDVIYEDPMVFNAVKGFHYFVEFQISLMRQNLVLIDELLSLLENEISSL